MNPRDLDLTAEEAAALLAREPETRLLDVREDAEWRAARIGSAIHATPDLARVILDDWDRDTPILVVCHHGIRSMIFSLRLLQAGFRQVRNLKGGLEAWSLRVDPTVPRYAIRFGEGLVLVE